MEIYFSSRFRIGYDSGAGGKLLNQENSPSPHEAVAPAWHTVVVLLVLLGFSTLGAYKASLPGIKTHSRIPGYIVAMIMEWGLTGFIWYAAKRRGRRMRDLIGGRWASFTDFIRDFGIGNAFMLVCGFGLTGVLTHLLQAKTPPGVRNLLPQGLAEIVVYLLLAATAGFCEELIFRGYLQRQFTAWTHAASAGIVLQGIVFGAAHGYQGWKQMVTISVYGITFGLLAMWRRSLRPGMIAHFLQDGIGGILGRHLMR